MFRQGIIDREVLAVVKAAAAPGFDLLEVDEPQLGPGEVLLEVAAASVCGTDVHLYDWNHWASTRVVPPRVMGHEICGHVVGLGDGVTNVNVGQRCAVESHIVCRVCAECVRGDFHVCARTRILGVDVDGGFAPYVVVPATNLWPVSNTFEPASAAALEPFGNAVHACSYGNLRGAGVVILGAGPIGCAAVAVARAEGARHIIAVDRNDYRLKLASSMGADALVQVDGGSLVEAIRRATSGDIDCALEMSGASAAIAAAIEVVRPGGWISLLGIGDTPTTLDVSSEVVMRGLSLFGVLGRRLFETWERTMAYVESGQIDPSAIITHHFPYIEIERAIALMKSGRCGKVSLTMS